MAELDVVPHGAVAVGADGRIVAVGPLTDVRRALPDAREEPARGVLFPGFVDSHTHAVFGAARVADHERRARGVSYQDIAAAGGGILSSVRDVRARGYDELLQLTRERLTRLLDLGTTTVEAKSGYGLAIEPELKQLDVLAACAATGTPRIIATFLGAHEVPLEFRDRPDEYVEMVTAVMLPEVANRHLARFCDVFCEPGVFTTTQSRRVLEAAQRMGFGLKLHADELDGSGGAELAAELGAISADHLGAVSDRGVDQLARGSTVATLLPGTMLFLGRSGHAPARRLIDAGAAVALATDFNPGSSPGMSLPLMAMLGVSQLRMMPGEAVMAITVNGAAAVGEAAVCGQLAEGFRADIVEVAIDDWRELPYWYGVNLVSRVWLGGRVVTPAQDT